MDEFNFEVVDENTPTFTDLKVDPAELRRMTEEAQASTKVSIPATSAEARKCEGCSQTYPKNTLYFPKAGSNFARSCHECSYKKKVAAGKPPNFPAKNGVDQKEYHAQLKGAPTPKKVTFDETPKGSSWLPIGRPKPPQDTPSTPPPSTPASTSQPNHMPPKMISSFVLDPLLAKARDGGLVLTINDYFKMGKLKQVPIREVVHPSLAPPAPQTTQPGSARAQLTPPPTVSTDNLPAAEEEQPPQEEEEDMIDPRAELFKNIVTFPANAARFELTIEKVQRMSEEECFYWWDTFRQTNAIMSYGQFVHTGICMVAQVAETSTKGINVTDDFHLDLTGYSEEIAHDEVIASTINEICRENEDTCDEYLGAEYRLALLLLGRAHKTAVINNRRRIEQKEKDNYLARAERYGVNRAATEAAERLSQSGGAATPGSR